MRLISRIGFAAVIVAACTLCLAWAAPAPAADDKPTLSDADCVKCHDKPPADIAAAGAQHKDVSCTDCHESHRPASKMNIPPCSNCHSDKPHYALKNCLECHKNPHRPLEMVLAKNLVDPCLTCHDKQIAQLRGTKSKHSLLACTVCHDVHRKIPSCVQCHKPHAADMPPTDCKLCHRAHMPTVLTYEQTVANKSCASCHKKAGDLIAATATKHQKVTCVACHKDKHKSVPDCQSCHPKPHAASFMVKFTKCGDCHYIAHDLNNWQATVVRKPGVPAAPAAPAAPKQ